MSITPTIVSSYPSPSTKRASRPASASPTCKYSQVAQREGKAASPLHAPDSGVKNSREPIDLPRRRRVKSALASDNRVITVSADNTPWGSKVWGETSYASHYSPKKLVTLSKPRPSSAIRMNNPHPSKMFLQWRVPTRIHPHSRSKQVDPVFLKDIQENFYQDYVSDENKTGGARHEVPITNVAKIPFPGNTALQNLQITGSKVSYADKQVSQAIPSTMPPISQEKILAKTLQPSSYMAYQQWIQNASEDEKRVLTKMLRAANVEDSKIKKALSDVFTKESLKHIKQWMHGADQNELSLAINVVNQLSKKSQVYSTSVTPQHNHHCYSKRLHRSRSWPKQQKMPSFDCNDFSISGRKLRPHSAEKCSDCSTSDTGMIYKSIKNNQIKLKYSQTPPQTILWHHKVKPPQVPRLLNRGALFGLPHQPKGQHFALHPEWPIA